MRNSLSEKIKKARDAKGITLEQLAKEVGSSKSYMWQLETAYKIKPSAYKIKPSAQLIAKIAKALDVTVDYLLDPEQENMNVQDEFSIFFRDYQSLDEDTRKGIRAQVEALKKIKKQKKTG